MRKSIKKFVILICSLALIFSLSGCSVLLNNNNLNNNGNVGSDGVVKIEINKQFIFADTGDYSASSTVTEVNFNTIENPQVLSYVEAAKKVMRSVVSISVKYSGGTSYASGVIVDAEGGLSENEYYLLTNFHVISSGGQISIYVPDDNCRNAGDSNYDENYVFTGVIGYKGTINQSVTLIGGDADTDVAVLKLDVGDRKNSANQPVDIDMATVPSVNDKVEYAEEVFAIGNPSGSLPMTFLSGNISYLDREVVLDTIGYMTLIQHDCMITHGSSGGGLFNMKGQLIGLTNGGSDEYKGMNYAVPFYGETGFVNVATELIKTNTLTNFGYVEGRWRLGVTIASSNETVQNSNVIIASVEKNGNADGLLQEGCYIINVTISDIMSYPITNLSEFSDAMYKARKLIQVGDDIEVTIAFAN